MNAHYKINPDLGIVYGIMGAPIRKKIRGYVVVNNGGKSIGFAHRMIWEYVYGEIPQDKQINHINGIKDDNRIKNLELVTPSENCLHAYRLGLSSAVGAKNGRAKLSLADISEIKLSQESCAAIAKKYGVTQSHISAIRKGKKWRVAA